MHTALHDLQLLFFQCMQLEYLYSNEKLSTKGGNVQADTTRKDYKVKKKLYFVIDNVLYLLFLHVVNGYMSVSLRMKCVGLDML